ncbi:MAG: carboxylesterase family protein [Bacteroidales bacterium]|nr:carboxylesterase family protein [Bacteroidales bacterium]
MKKVALFFILMAVSLCAAAQETYRFAQRDTCSLYLDIFRAAEGSETTFQGKAKPAVMFVFGGGFVMGQRSDAFTMEWVNRLNQEGYDVVTIDYRLGMKDFKVGKGLAGIFKASDRFVLSQQVGVEDVFSAVAFLADNQDLGIDVGNMVLSGSSAGAIISLASEYNIVNGNTEGLPAGFNFRGVMSFAGAIISNTGAPKFKSAPCPILLLHGTADKAVQYKKFSAFGRGVWGSSWLAKQFAKNGWNHCIYRFKDRTHAVAAYMNYVWPLEKDFLEQNVILGASRTVDSVVDDPTLPSWDWANISTDDIY